MRLSLATRSLLGSVLIIALLGSVTTFAIVSMDRMRRQVSLMRRDLLPAGTNLQQLSRETAAYHAALKRSRDKDPGWVRQALTAYRPFPRVEKIAEHLRRVGNALADGEALIEIADRVDALQDGEDLLLELQREPGVLNPPVVAWLEEMTGHTNRAVYDALVVQYLEESEGGETRLSVLWRDMILASLKFLLHGLRGIHADYTDAAEATWEAVEGRERTAVVAASVLGGAALLVSVLLSLLALRWLGPIRRLREMANRIAKGQYDAPPRVPSRTELGDLALDLGRMAGKLRQREEMIRSQAEELLRSERLSAIGKMSTQIAHEIRNPLNAIGLRLEILEESVADLSGEISEDRVEELSTLTEALSREVERLTEVTEYYLRFAKFPHPQREPMDLSSMIADLLSFFREEAKAAGAEVSWDVPETLPIQADNNLLRQALMNLVKNALEALAQMPTEGGGRMHIKAWEEEGRARIRVRDNGAGIPAGDQARIFEPFFTTKEAGTGLGLTLVQQIIREHGGEVSVSSGPGEGTTFHVDLPLS
ncbi:MAG: ATP-binding protein [Pseudomonadota bacterium]